MSERNGQVIVLSVGLIGQYAAAQPETGQTRKPTASNLSHRPAQPHPPAHVITAYADLRNELVHLHSHAGAYLTKSRVGAGQGGVLTTTTVVEPGVGLPRDIDAAEIMADMV